MASTSSRRALPRELLLLAGSVLAVALIAVASGIAISSRAVEPSRLLGADTVQATLREGTNVAVALSPDGRTFAMDLQGTLWSLPLQGGEARAISDVYGDIRQPSWSPDGSLIAFQSYRAGNWHIWTARPNGNELRQLTRGGYDDREPHWSPDGTRIVFASDRSGTFDLWEVTVATGEVRRLTDDPAEEDAPAYSPDGSVIALVVQRDGAGEIQLLDRQGGRRTLLSMTGTLAAPTWSRDGRRIVFQRLDGVETGLYVLEVPASGPARAPRLISAPDEDVFPFRVSWTADDELVYTADGRIKRRSIVGEHRGEIPFAATVTLVRDRYTPRGRDFDTGAPQRALGIVSPVVSPSGDQVVFTALSDLWLLRIGAAQPTRLTEDPYIAVSPTWSPDGAHVAYISDRGGSMDLWIREMRSGRERQLTRTPDAVQSPAWSPDGSRIAFLNQDGEVHAVNVASGATERLHPRIPNPGRPTWAADGRTIALAFLGRHSSHYREGVNQILFIPLEEGESWTFSPEPNVAIGPRGNNPVWSPDGRHLAFLMRGFLWVQPVTPDGRPDGAPRQLTREIADDPSWTGDSRTIVFMAHDRIKRVSLDGGSAEEIPLQLTWTNRNPTGRSVVHAGRFFDGLSPEVRHDIDLVIEGNRIVAIEPHSDALHTGRVVDASGLTVIPGLFDMHSHMGDGSPADALGEIIGYGESLGRLFLSYGITSIREPSAYPYTARERMEASASGARLLPRIFFTGGSLDGTRTYYSADHAIETEEQLERELERTRVLGYDMIKTYVRLPDAFQKRAIQFAHSIGIPVSSHEIYPAVAYGSDGVEHMSATSRRGYSPKASLLMRTYQDNVELLTRSGMFYDATFGIHGAFDMVLLDRPELATDERVRTLAPPFQFERLQRRLERAHTRRAFLEARVKHQRETIRRVVEGGGRLTSGTDSPVVPYGIAAVGEIVGFAQSGITPFKAIEAATRNAAESAGMGAHLGTLEVGKIADLVAVEGNPLENIDDLWRTRFTMLNGVVHDRASLLRRP